MKYFTLELISIFTIQGQAPEWTSIIVVFLYTDDVTGEILCFTKLKENYLTVLKGIYRLFVRYTLSCG